jgi:hypothetical protein
MEARKLLNKINEDFEGAVEHRDTTPLSCWTLVHNDHDGLPTEVHELVIKFRATHEGIKVEIWSPETIITTIMEIPIGQLRLLFPEGLSSQELRKITYKEIDELIESLGSLDPETDFSSPEAPSKKKIAHNGFSSSIAEMLKGGLLVEKRFGDYFRETSRAFVGNRLAERFKQTFKNKLADGCDSDEIFYHLIDSVGGLNCEKKRRAAIIGLISYLFHTCEIFENPPMDQVV